MTVWQPTRLLSPVSGDTEEVAVRDGNRSITWSELEIRARRFATGLRSLGLEHGGRWAMLSPNRVEWAEAALGSARAGTRCVPVNWHLSAGEIRGILRDSDARIVVTDPMYADLAREAARGTADTGADTQVVPLDEHYERWMTNGSDSLLPDFTAGTVLQYTGGTTGPSRGVERPESPGQVSEFARRQSVWADLTGMPTHGAAMLVTPAYHALGGAVLRNALARGLPLTMLDAWDPVAVLETIQSRRITGTAMVPTQFIRLLKLDHTERVKYDVTSLEWVLHTAAPCPGWAKREMIEWFGPVIVELYGSSEGAGPVICTSQEWLDRPGTVGRAVGALRLSIIDDDGHDLPPGEIGTVYAHRPDGPPKYHGDDEKSRSIRLADGRFTVGDIGWLDDDGYLYLADRRVDLMIRGGTNVYPAEIEAVLSEHPGVADVAVFGVPDPEWGHRIVALVELTYTADATAPEVLLGHCRSHLASFKIPQVLEIVDQLPREASGKLKKRHVRDDYLARAHDDSAAD